jgi:hypothetical protein
MANLANHHPTAKVAHQNHVRWPSSNVGVVVHVVSQQGRSACRIHTSAQVHFSNAWQLSERPQASQVNTLASYERAPPRAATGAVGLN